VEYRPAATTAACPSNHNITNQQKHTINTLPSNTTFPRNNSIAKQINITKTNKIVEQQQRHDQGTRTMLSNNN